MSLEEI